MKAEEVAQFLNQHPEFFEEYAEMLAEVVIPHPHGGRAIPIAERKYFRAGKVAPSRVEIERAHTLRRAE
jgi:uncharacterized protein YigA (DUF484 family)